MESQIPEWTFRCALLPLDPDHTVHSDDDCCFDSTQSYENLQLTETILQQCHPFVSAAFYKRFSFKCLTSVQLATIPFILKNFTFDKWSPYCSDIVITAPTGQGKTLCYALPIVSNLLYRHSPQIRALIFAPTRELVVQIRNVFLILCASECHIKDPSTPGLRVTVLAGLSSFPAEVKELQGHFQESGISKQSHQSNKSTNVFFKNDHPSDIVIATPGRFVEHIHSTPHSTALSVLKDFNGLLPTNMSYSQLTENTTDKCHSNHLWKFVKWLVFDEADRLLDQTYHHWISDVTHIVNHCCQVRPQKIIASATMTRNPEKLKRLDLQRPLFFLTSTTEGSYSVPPGLKQYWILSPLLSETFDSIDSKSLTLLYLLHQLYTPNVETQKSVHAREDTPSDMETINYNAPIDQTTSDTILCHSNKKCLKTVIFCSSKLMARRLSILIDCHFGINKDLDRHTVTQQPPEKLTIVELSMRDIPMTGKQNHPEDISGSVLHLECQEFSSHLSQVERSKLIRRFQNNTTQSNTVDILVSSDVLARGLDIDSLDVVINYDSPPNLKTYIHRIGRTARAGKQGTTFTIVNQEELKVFKKLLKNNKLPYSDTPDMTLWDVVHKHIILKDHLKPWVTLPSFKKTDSNDVDIKVKKQRLSSSTFSTTTESYYNILVKQLDSSLNALK